ncbi:hypothetical protein ACFWBX_18380 [Streptomyces sp. NPDC059991]|uniref:hypothetical protein n=1 Tax=Streptomyces sp. NPDC059991 TaxID=3347028 RepID=UPI0036B13DE9
MDLEGVGALSAAAVALIGIPASVLIGRWQLRATLRTAEATSEAGLAQAASAYRAALDAVRAEANAAHLQWRRSIQREAYASFLLAANRVRDLGERFAMENTEALSAESIRSGKSSLEDTLAALKEAQTIIELEGPDSVAAPAAGMARAAEIMGYHLRKQAVYERAWGKLSRISDAELPDVSSTAARLMEALSGLRSIRSSNPSLPDAADTPATRAAVQSCREAGSALPPDALDHEEFEALLEGWRSRPPTYAESYFDAVHQFSEEEPRFVHAAKIELHASRP